MYLSRRVYVLICSLVCRLFFLSIADFIMSDSLAVPSAHTVDQAHHRGHDAANARSPSPTDHQHAASVMAAHTCRRGASTGNCVSCLPTHPEANAQVHSCGCFSVSTYVIQRYPIALALMRHPPSATAFTLSLSVAHRQHPKLGQ